MLNLLLSAILLLSSATIPAHAQVIVTPPVSSAPAAPAPIANLYAAGISYSAGATPAVAGSALYAHQVASTGTYAFTLIDALPATIKPFTVSTNVAVGIAQKVATIDGVPILVPTGAGISYSGTNTGWSWSTGAAAPIKFKGSYYIVPTLRVLKSSVSGGSGYQPVLGVLFGWGQ